VGDGDGVAVGVGVGDVVGVGVPKASRGRLVTEFTMVASPVFVLLAVATRTRRTRWYAVEVPAATKA
jgi:hypothetical protein